jgi:hypothetical protein
MKDGHLILKSIKNSVHYRKSLAGNHKTLQAGQTSDADTEFDQHDDKKEWEILTKNAKFELHDATHVKNNGGVLDDKTRRLLVEANSNGTFSTIKVFCRPKARKAENETHQQKKLGRRRVEHAKNSNVLMYYPKYWGRNLEKTKIRISASENPQT